MVVVLVAVVVVVVVVGSSYSVGSTASLGFLPPCDRDSRRDQTAGSSSNTASPRVLLETTSNSIAPLFDIDAGEGGSFTRRRSR